MRMLPPEQASGLPQEDREEDREAFELYKNRMRMLVHVRVKALTTNDPIPLHTVVAYRFVPRPRSTSIRLQVRLEDNSEHILDGGGTLYALAEHGFLPDIRRVKREDVRWDGPWHAYYPQLFALPKS